MRNRVPLVILTLVGLLVLAGCKPSRVNDSSTDVPRDFTVKVSGTVGLVVDLLVIVKPDAGSIKKVVDEEVTIPYTRQFTGVGHAVWVGGVYKGREGEYTLRIGGSTASGIVKQGGAKDESCLSDL